MGDGNKSLKKEYVTNFRLEVVKTFYVHLYCGGNYDATSNT